MASKVFSPSFGNRASRLVGRQDVLEQFERCTESAPGNRERALLLLGQRGSGKTVLLWELADMARAGGFAVASPTTASDGMLTRIVEKLQDDSKPFLKSRKSRISGANVGAFGFSAGLHPSRDEGPEGRSRIISAPESAAYSRSMAQEWRLVFAS